MEKEKFISQIVEEDDGARVTLIDNNKTLIVDQYTDNPVENEFFENPRTMKDVFEHYQPSVEVEFTDRDGNSKVEKLEFHDMQDFDVNGGKGKLVSNSQFLSGVQNRIEGVKKVHKQLENNPRLRNILKDEAGREALKAMLQSMLDELNQVNK